MGSKKFVGICACAVIVVLDITAGIMGFKAKEAQNHAKHLSLFIFECKGPSHDAYVLSLAAMGLFLIAHVLTNLVGGCGLCNQKSSLRKQVAFILFVFTWVCLVGGMILLWLGMKSNHKSRKSCGISYAHNFLWLGGIVCMVHAFLAVGYFVILHILH